MPKMASSSYSRSLACIVPLIMLLASTHYVEGAQVPITSYICTHPNLPGYINDPQCTGNFSSGFRTCETEEGASSDHSIDIGGFYGWSGNTNPFMVLDIPQGWCVGSVEVTFPLITGSVIPTLSLSVHSAERLSNNTDRTVFTIVSEENRQVVLNLTPHARGLYLRISMTSAQTVYLQDIEVLGTNDGICTHSSSASGNLVSLTTSVGSSTYSVTSVPYAALSTPVPTPSSTITTGEYSLMHLPMSTSFPRDTPTYNVGSTDLEYSAGVSSAVFFAGLLAGVALACPAGVLTVVCYYWNRKQAKTRGKDSTMSENEELAYDCPVKLEENPAYEAMQK